LGKLRENLDASDIVLRKCREIQREISNIPPGILKLLSPRLAKKFLKLIVTWWSGALYPLSVLREPSRARINVFKTVFRSFLTRYVQKLDMRCIPEQIVLDVILENLGSMPGLFELYLDTVNIDCSRLLAGIVHLENLQTFTYRWHCTDEIIAQLQRYCPLLTELNVSYSHGVTNASVQPLRAARKLKFLVLYGTGIDDEHYGLLLSELPNVANITIRGKEKFHFTSHRSGKARYNNTRQSRYAGTRYLHPHEAQRIYHWHDQYYGRSL
jgi:hypothetical protein